MAAAGLEARVFDVTGPREEHETEIAAFLARPDRPRAVVVWSDLDAVPLLGLTHRAGIRVPEDLAIVGYDNSSIAASPIMDLASFDQNGRGLGRQAAQALLSRIAGRLEPEHRLVEPRVVLRSSR
jgi:LacI family transcriptional regulator